MNTHTGIKRAAQLGFAFFLLKGLAWLALPLIAAAAW